MEQHRYNAYDAGDFWFNAIHDPGASQMVYLKNLMLSRSYFERIPDQTLVNNPGERYDHIAATRGTVFAFAYTFNGRNIELNMGKIEGGKVKATWYDPRTGREQTIGIFENKGTMVFDPPGEKQNGNDWVLILDSSL